MKNKNILIVVLSVIIIALVALIILLNNGNDEILPIIKECQPITGGGFTVEFETNGGNTIEPRSVCIACSPDSYEIIPTALKDGYTFEGWYYDEELTDKVDGETMLFVIPNPKIENDDCIVGYNTVKLYAKYIEE